MDHPLKSRLLQAKQSLNDWYDALNRAWQEAEETIVSMNVGREVAVHLFDDEPEYVRDPDTGDDIVASPVYSHYLAFLKHHGKWQICYGTVPVGWDWCNEYVHSWKPIRECSKEQRVEAAEDLPRLLATVVEEAEKVSAEVEGAVGLLKEAVTPFKAR